jgi:hypothetical protein
MGADGFTGRRRWNVYLVDTVLWILKVEQEDFYY